MCEFNDDVYDIRSAHIIHRGNRHKFQCPQIVMSASVGLGQNYYVGTSDNFRDVARVSDREVIEARWS